MGGFALLLVVAACAWVYTQAFNIDNKRSRAVVPNSQRDTQQVKTARTQAQIEADSRLAAKKAAVEATLAQAQAEDNACTSIDDVLAKRAETRKREQEASEAKAEERRKIDEAEAAAEDKERRKASEARMIAAYKERRNSAAVRRAAREIWKQEEAKQAERKRRIQVLINKGVFQKVEFGVQGATAWVGPTFYGLSLYAKLASCSVVANNPEGEFAVPVTLKDIQSGKTVGDYDPDHHWSWSGLKMY